MKNIFIPGKNLAIYRKNVNLTQAEIASALGVTRVTVTGWEKQVEVELTENQAKKLETLLKTSIDVLTKVPHETSSNPDVLDHPVIKSLVEQSRYILDRVAKLEKENEDLRNRLGGSGA